MICKKCKSKRIANVFGKCITCNVVIDGTIQSKIPLDMNIGGGDYISFEYCLDCGKIHGDFPLDTTSIESWDDDLIE